MKQILRKCLLGLPILLCSLQSEAQTSFGHYNFSVTNQPYNALSGAVNQTSGRAWDDGITGFSIPFDLVINDDTVNIVYVNYDGWLSTDTDFISSSGTSTLKASAFIATDMDWFDIANIDTSQKSEISSIIDGTAPNRILKIEFSNVFTYDEYDITGDLTQFANFQIWAYEGSNTLEVRFGSTNNTDFHTYGFSDSGEPFTGILKSTTNDVTFYYTSGTPTAPTIDSIVTNITTQGYPLSGLSQWPVNGTVYKFDLISGPNNIVKVEWKNKVELFPTQSSKMITIRNATNEVLNAQIFDISGKLYNQPTEVLNGDLQVNIEHLAAGKYFITMSDQNGQIKSLPFVKL